MKKLNDKISDFKNQDNKTYYCHCLSSFIFLFVCVWFGIFILEKGLSNTTSAKFFVVAEGE